MGNHQSKRYQAAAEHTSAEQFYTVDEAIAAIKAAATAHFDETLEVAIRLGVDPSKGEQTVRGTISLPHGTGRTPRVAVFAKGAVAMAAEAAGADRVGAEDLVEEIEGGWSDFDILVAHVELMKNVGRLGKKLGPRMPNKKAGTIVANEQEMGTLLQELKAGRVEYKMDKAAILHVPIGKASFDAQALAENLAALLGAIVRARPAAAKGRYILKISLSSTMGPSAKLDLQDALARAA